MDMPESKTMGKVKFGVWQGCICYSPLIGLPGNWVCRVYLNSSDNVARCYPFTGRRRILPKLP